MKTSTFISIAVLVITGFALATSGAVWAEGGSQSYESHLALGDSLAARQDFGGAISAYRDAVKTAPHQGDARIGLALALVDRGEELDDGSSKALFEEALELSERLVVTHPDRAKSHYCAGVAAGRLALFVGGKSKVKLSQRIKDGADRALELDPAYTDAYILRGIYFYELATLNRALRLFAKVFFGGVPPGSLDDAAADLNRAIELEPKLIYPHYNLARVFYKQERYAEARHHCELIEKLPDDDHLDPRTRLDAKKLLGKIDKEVEKKKARRR